MESRYYDTSGPSLRAGRRVCVRACVCAGPPALELNGCQITAFLDESRLGRDERRRACTASTREQQQRSRLNSYSSNDDKTPSLGRCRRPTLLAISWRRNARALAHLSRLHERFCSKRSSARRFREIWRHEVLGYILYRSRPRAVEFGISGKSLGFS